MTLQDELDAFKADFEAKVPPEAVAVMHRATAELHASGQAARALPSGARAPAFALPDTTGKIVRSDDLLMRGPLVLAFYRGSWCSYCNLNLKAIEAIAGEVRALGASIVAVSPQTVANLRSAQRDLRLSFPLLSDHGNATAQAFGVRVRLPDDLIAVLKSLGTDLAFANGEPSWTLPMPGRYVIDRDGIIDYAEVNPDYTCRPEPGELLPILKRLQAQAAA